MLYVCYEFIEGLLQAYLLFEQGGNFIFYGS